MKILIADKLSAKTVCDLEDLGAQVIVKPELTADELSGVLGDVEVRGLIYACDIKCGGNLTCKEGINENINDVELVRKCLDFSNIISTIKNTKDTIQDYKNILRQEAVNIHNYLAAIKNVEDNDKTLSAFKWNEYATQVGNN